jgi:ATP-binding cassette subfamily C exporter for protease/lipase
MFKSLSVPELGSALKKFDAVWRMAIFLSLIIGLLGFTSTVYMLEVYDRVVNSRSLTTLASLTVMTLTAYALMEFLEKIRSRLLWGVGIQFELKFSSRIYNAMFDGLRQKNVSGAISVQSDFKSVREFFYNPALSAAFELPIALVSLVLIFAINPWLGWAAVVGAVAQSAVAWWMQRVSREPMLQAQQRSQAAQTYAEAALRNAHVMASMGMFDAISVKWQKYHNGFLALQSNASEAAGGLNAVAKLLQHLVGSVLLGLGAWFFLRNELNGGAAMMIISSVLGGRLLAPLAQIIQQWSAIVNVSAAWSRLETLLAEVPARSQNMPLPAPNGHLQVESLSASPPGQNTLVLNGLKFDVPPGKVLAVVGPSAAGKTSLAKLMLGIWSPVGGKVRLDGVDVHAWDKTELGPFVGYLPQGVELLEGSLAENIARFGQLDMSRVEAAAHRVGLHEFITGLPNGYETQVGRDGGGLSGGQRQRVGLARALYGEPIFVVLDEPNSSLDEAGDMALNEAIAALKSQGTTFVVMTHRTHVLAVSDFILVMRDGGQSAFGPSAEVLQKLRGLQSVPSASVQGA